MWSKRDVFVLLTFCFSAGVASVGGSATATRNGTEYECSGEECGQYLLAQLHGSLQVSGAGTRAPITDLLSLLLMSEHLPPHTLPGAPRDEPLS